MTNGSNNQYLTPYFYSDMSSHICIIVWHSSMDQLVGIILVGKQPSWFLEICIGS